MQADQAAMKANQAAMKAAMENQMKAQEENSFANFQAMKNNIMGFSFN
jgi:hypothetical protein